ncbi:MAG: molybdopterin molybdotransferase MoeA [Abditibacteriales bacterium]|nr:molybdopterin molybdotransferase MoeA [Abditibacteriales bacterium]MDW8366486.1 molybdopterin molybdotransferase MoeA [Abditibacteriales bacterium]
MLTNISVRDALAIVLDCVHPLPTERVPLLQSLGRTLAEDVYADINVPPFPCAAVDGYAVIAADVAGASSGQPAVLQVIEEISAGAHPTRPLRPGTAARIYTGAPVPEGADAVVMQEVTARGDEGRVQVFEPIEVGRNLRPAGEDVRAGELVMERGTWIRPAEMGMLAACGVAEPLVARQPRVLLISTGDEIKDVSEPLAPGQIRDSNTYALAGLILKYGGVVHAAHKAVDRVDDLLRIFQRHAGEVDAIVSSGGVSVGDYDLVQDVLQQVGAVKFWKVTQRPGGPVLFGTMGKIPVFGLPGYPVSCMVGFELYVRPALLKMQGRRALRKMEVVARVDQDLKATKGKTDFVRVWVALRDGAWVARVAGKQVSGRLSTMIRSNGLLVIPEDVTQVKAGQMWKVQMLDDPEVEGDPLGLIEPLG